MSGGSDMDMSGFADDADISTSPPPVPPAPPLPPVPLLLLPQPPKNSSATPRIVMRCMQALPRLAHQSKRRAVAAIAPRARPTAQLPSLLADWEIAHGRRRAWDGTLRCEMPRRRGECRREASAAHERQHR